MYNISLLSIYDVHNIFVYVSMLKLQLKIVVMLCIYLNSLKFLFYFENYNIYLNKYNN